MHSLCGMLVKSDKTSSVTRIALLRKRPSWSSFGGGMSLIYYSIHFFLSYSLFLIQICSIFFIIFFQAVTVTNSAISLVLSAVRIFLSLTTVTVTLA